MSHSPLYSLNANTIDLWLAKPEQICEQSLLSAYDGLMNDEEREKQQKKRHPQAKKEALVARALVRTVLSKYACVESQDWQFIKGEKGKPEILNPPIPLRFNLSHTSGLMVCAVTLEADLGVDVEFIERKNSLLKIAESKFAPVEFAELLSHPEDNRKNRFFDYWTLKESYIKAVGGGLSIPLDEFHFAIKNDQDITINFEPRRNDDSSTWHNRLMWGSDVHRIAISVKDPQKRNIRTFETVPLSSDTEIQLK